MKRIDLLKVSISLYALILLMAMGCSSSKKGTDCQTCTARNTSEQVIATQSVCSQEAEDSFRNAYSDDIITCQ